MATARVGGKRSYDDFLGTSYGGFGYSAHAGRNVEVAARPRFSASQHGSVVQGQEEAASSSFARPSSPTSPNHLAERMDSIMMDSVMPSTKKTKFLAADDENQSSTPSTQAQLISRAVQSLPKLTYSDDCTFLSSSDKFVAFSIPSSFIRPHSFTSSLYLDLHHRMFPPSHRSISLFGLLLSTMTSAMTPFKHHSTSTQATLCLNRSLAFSFPSHSSSFRPLSCDLIANPYYFLILYPFPSSIEPTDLAQGPP